MKAIDDIYSTYLSDKLEIESKYNNALNKIKKEKIENCEFEIGMPVKFHTWVGRVKELEFTGIKGVDSTIDDFRMIVQISDTAGLITIYEKDFDRITILGDSPPSKKEKILELNSSKNDIEERYREELVILKDRKRCDLKRIDEEIIEITKNCIHHWDLDGRIPNHLNTSFTFEKICRCQLCGKTVRIKTYG